MVVVSAQEPPTLEDAEAFLREQLADGEWHWSADVKAAGALRGLSPKMLWLAQERVSVWFTNTSTFPRWTLWRLDESELEGEGERPPETSEPLEDVSRQALLSEFEQTIREHFGRCGE